MKITSALMACTLAGAAHAQYFEIVINPPAPGDTYPNPGGIIEYSLWLRDGQLFPDFQGWASFAGRISAGGTHLIPNETATDTSGGAWEGRRPPSTTAFPGGSAGGFRFSGQTYTAIPNGLEGAGGLAFEGLAASVPLGGFLHDASPDLEVFRGSFIFDVLGIFEIEFVAVDAAYFIGDYSNTAIGVQSQMGSVGARYAILPAPASTLLIGAGMLAVRRRR